MKRFLLVAAALVCSLAFVVPAGATTLTLDDLVGYVVPATPANLSDELAYANNLINWYNGDIANPSGGGYTYTLDAGSNVPAPDLPLATGPGSQSVGVPGYPIDVTGYTYLFAKFGADGALFYLDGYTSIDGFDPATGPFDAQGHGLSHIALFGPGTPPPPPPRVPEGGATLMMVGFGLAGVGMLRRFLKR